MSPNQPSQRNSDSGNHLNLPVSKPNNSAGMRMMKCLRKKNQLMNFLKDCVSDLAYALLLVGIMFLLTSAAWLPTLFSWNS